MFKGYAVMKEGGSLEPYEYEPGSLGRREVEIEITFCGLCHSDVSMIKNEWGNATYPLIPGHEIVGSIVRKGDDVANLEQGQRVGVGWFSSSCRCCRQCLDGSLNLCNSPSQTIVGRHGGFANKIKVSEEWVFPIPDSIPSEHAGPLFCGGITVFSPLLLHEVKPTDKVGVIGVGGLGHMALKFLHAWGCEVSVFSSSPSKEKQATSYGATHFIDSTHTESLEDYEGYFDLILSTVNVALDWNAYIAALAPKGHLHFVGAVLEPLDLSVFPMLLGQKTVGASPLGSPDQVYQMLEFAARHQIAPEVKVMPLSSCNDAVTHLSEEKPDYRVVLDCQN